MRLLLDTHTFLWFISGNDQLSEKARRLISDPENEILLSVDPFDRLIIAQAISEGIPLVARDGAFKDYPVQLLW